MTTPTTSEGCEPPSIDEVASNSLSYKIKAGAFLAFTGGFGMLAGFAGALGQAKKQDPTSFDKGMTGQDAEVEAATKKAVRNLDNAALERIRSERALHESGMVGISSKLLMNPYNESSFKLERIKTFIMENQFSNLFLRS